jgi:type I restriction enzyme S subunit
MSGSKIYKQSTSSPIANLVLYFTNEILDEEYAGKLSDYIDEIQTGKTPPMNVSKYYSSNDIGWVKPSDIGKGKYLTDLPDKLSQVAIDENKATIYKPGTLLIICIGAGVGRVALTNEVISSNQQITGILFNENVIPEYAYYYFFCREAVFKQNASQTTLPIINQKGLKELEFRCPDISVQKIFLSYIHYCEECLDKEKIPLKRDFELPDIVFDTTKKFFIAYFAQNNILKELDQQQTYLQLLRQSILQEAVQGKLTKQDPNEEPATVLLQRIKAEKAKLIKEGKLKKEKELPPITEDEIPFELPEGWVWCRIGDISECLDHIRRPIKKELRKEGTVPYYGANGQVGLIDEYLFDEDLVLVVEDETFIGRTKPFSYIIKGKSWVNNHAHVLRPAGKITVEFLNILLCRYDFIPLTSGTTGRKKLTKQGLLAAIISLPPLPEQQRIVAKVQQLQLQLSKLEGQVQQSRQYEQQLLQSVLQESFEDKVKRNRENLNLPVL